MCEKTKYKIDFEIAQHHCNGSSVCGDSFKAFEDGFGNFNIILSDGMGTGKSAAKEGSLLRNL